MPDEQTPEEFAAMILREVIMVKENGGDLAAHAQDAANRTTSEVAGNLIGQHMLQAAFAEDPVESLRKSAEELEASVKGA